MKTELFDFELPEASIARYPRQQRDGSKLLVVERKSRTIRHCQFTDFPQLVPDRTRLLRNTVSVLPARLKGKRANGGTVECLLLEPCSASPSHTWHCLLKPAKRLPIGSLFYLGEANDFISARVLDKDSDGRCRVEFVFADVTDSVEAFALRHGALPLPPYLKREVDAAIDIDRYQTVYADSSKRRAVAAPTAGLHFTPHILAELQARDLHFHDIVLDIGLGTFRPVKSDRLEAHEMHQEGYWIPQQTRSILDAHNSPQLAVGTTTLRAIEAYMREPRSAAGDDDSPQDFRGRASLFLYPPAQFYGVDTLLTNFHLPRSTLLCLVAAFLSPGDCAGIEWLHAIYRQAIERDYRFFSYGDAMLIL